MLLRVVYLGVGYRRKWGSPALKVLLHTNLIIRYVAVEIIGIIAGDQSIIISGNRQFAVVTGEP
jgi:septum formation inhibitor-activating ATPase MinD